MAHSPYTASPQFEHGQFVNRLPHTEPAMLPMLRRWFFEKTSNATPSAPVAVRHRTHADFATIADQPRVTWLGHSTSLVELDGQRLLIDPVWGDYASPGALFGVKRFYPPPLSWQDLPPVDAVLLSHDHYDHLDHTTIRRFARLATIPRFIVPLGVAARLTGWGIPASRITELDWWDESLVGPIRVVATPARHFSGRVLWDRDSTLWCGWALLGTSSKIYYGGDSAFFGGFRQVGERLGPFDLTLLEIGAYDPAWPDVHMGPEQAVQAHLAADGGVLLPVHWGLFKLAFHGWTEPVERVIAAAAAAGVLLAIPRPGESVIVGAAPPPVERWWPALPWRTAVEQPIVSTGL